MPIIADVQCYIEWYCNIVVLALCSDAVICTLYLYIYTACVRWCVDRWRKVQSAPASNVVNFHPNSNEYDFSVGYWFTPPHRTMAVLFASSYNLFIFFSLYGFIALYSWQLQEQPISQLPPLLLCHTDDVQHDLPLQPSGNLHPVFLHYTHRTFVSPWVWFNSFSLNTSNRNVYIVSQNTKVLSSQEGHDWINCFKFIVY